MKSVTMKGKNVDEAVSAALQVLGLTKEQVSVRVINEGKGGVLGVFGGEDAEVEVKEKLSHNELAKSFLQGILDRMGFVALADITGEENGRIMIEIKGEDMGRIIGKDGATLNALQSLVSTMTGRTVKERVRVTLDAEGYRNRRKGAIERITQEAVNDVERMEVEKILPPMSPADRRIVHMFVKDKTKLSSYSIGERSDRRVVITVASKAPKDVSDNAEEGAPEGEK